MNRTDYENLKKIEAVLIRYFFIDTNVKYIICVYYDEEKETAIFSVEDFDIELTMNEIDLLLRKQTIYKNGKEINLGNIKIHIKKEKKQINNRIQKDGKDTSNLENNPVRISLDNFQKCGLCITDNDKLIYNVLYDILKVHDAELSFKNIELVTFSFLNSAIAPLYNLFGKEIKNTLRFVDVTKHQEMLINSMRENAISYYKNKNKFDNLLKETLEEIGVEYNEK